jgi:hypothetical protein
MSRLWILACILFLSLSLLPGAPVADPPQSLSVAQGLVDKVEKESISIRPRGADGKFQKTLVLKITGTSRITTLAPQTREGKQVLMQRDTQTKDLQPQQSIAVIYTDGDAPVLLSAVVQPAAAEK